MRTQRKQIAVLASHEGSLFQYLADACENNVLQAEIAVLISNNSRSGAMKRARLMQIPTVHLSGATHTDPDALDTAILQTLIARRIDLVVLAGYMKKLGPLVLEHYRNHIINTHPALLPLHGGKGMYGRKVHEVVLASGARETGATVHQVIADYDTGPVLGQIRIPVLPQDTVERLEARVKVRERELLVETIGKLLEDLG